MEAPLAVSILIVALAGEYSGKKKHKFTGRL